MADRPTFSDPALGGPGPLTQKVGTSNNPLI